MVIFYVLVQFLDNTNPFTTLESLSIYDSRKNMDLDSFLYLYEIKMNKLSLPY